MACRWEIETVPFMCAGLGLVPPFKKGTATSWRVCNLHTCNISLYWLKPWEYLNSQAGKFSLEWESRDQVTSRTLVLTHIWNLCNPKADKVCVMEQARMNWAQFTWNYSSILKSSVKCFEDNVTLSKCNGTVLGNPQLKGTVALQNLSSLTLEQCLSLAILLIKQFWKLRP